MIEGFKHYHDAHRTDGCYIGKISGQKIAGPQGPRHQRVQIVNEVIGELVRELVGAQSLQDAEFVQISQKDPADQVLMTRGSKLFSPTPRSSVTGKVEIDMPLLFMLGAGDEVPSFGNHPPVEIGQLTEGYYQDSAWLGHFRAWVHNMLDVPKDETPLLLEKISEILLPRPIVMETFVSFAKMSDGEKDKMLQFILAHELAHWELRGVGQIEERRAWTQFTLGAVGIGCAVGAIGFKVCQKQSEDLPLSQTQSLVGITVMGLAGIGYLALKTVSRAWVENEAACDEIANKGSKEAVEGGKMFWGTILERGKVARRLVSFWPCDFVRSAYYRLLFDSRGNYRPLNITHPSGSVRLAWCEERLKQ